MVQSSRKETQKRNFLTVYNGFPAATGGILKGDSGKLSAVWPRSASGTDTAVWEEYRNSPALHRTAKLENGKLQIYRVEFVYEEESGMVLDYNMVFEEEIGMEVIREP